MWIYLYWLDKGTGKASISIQKDYSLSASKNFYVVENHIFQH